VGAEKWLIHRSAGDLPRPHLIIDSDTIRIVPKAVNLGFTLNSRLTPVDHYSKVCQKIYWVLRGLRPHASWTPVETRKKLIETHVNYSNTGFAHIDVASARKLGVANNACLRYIHGVQSRDSSKLQNRITRLTLKASATLQIFKFLYKIIHFQHLSYIFSLLQYSSSQRTNNPNTASKCDGAMVCCSCKTRSQNIEWSA
jgi:hypothetical protein